MHDKISFQFIIAGGTGLYMIQKFFQFVHRQTVIDKARDHTLCCSAIHSRHRLHLPYSCLAAHSDRAVFILLRSIA